MTHNHCIYTGDALDLIERIEPKSLDLVATDPPYAFGGSGPEHAISATVAVVLREAALRLKPGGWMLVMCASSWRSQAYMVEAVRGILEPVRVATWVKEGGTTKVKTPGWRWSTAKVIAMRRGKSAPLYPGVDPDSIIYPVLKGGRRAELPEAVCRWMVQPYIVHSGRALDPFAGSGAIVRAMSQMGMAATGFEVRP